MAWRDNRPHSNVPCPQTLKQLADHERGFSTVRNSRAWFIAYAICGTGNPRSSRVLGIQGNPIYLMGKLFDDRSD